MLLHPLAPDHTECERDCVAVLSEGEGWGNEKVKDEDKDLFPLLEVGPVPAAAVSEGVAAVSEGAASTLSLSAVPVLCSHSPAVRLPALLRACVPVSVRWWKWTLG